MNRYILTLSSLAVALLAACSPYDVRVPIPELPDPPPLPPLLEIVHPYQDLVYTTVDDIDPDLPGIQLEARIKVEDLANEVWLEDIGLSQGDIERRLEVREELNGSRFAVTTLTFDAPEQTQPFRVVAKAESLATTLVDFKVAP